MIPLMSINFELIWINYAALNLHQIAVYLSLNRLSKIQLKSWEFVLKICIFAFHYHMIHVDTEECGLPSRKRKVKNRVKFCFENFIFQFH